VLNTGSRRKDIPTTPDEREHHPDESDRYVPVRYAAVKLLAIPLVWPFVALFAFKVPVPYIIFFGGFLFVPASAFCGLSWLMNRRPERYFIRFALFLEIIVAVVAIAIATRL